MRFLLFFFRVTWQSLFLALIFSWLCRLQLRRSYLFSLSNAVFFFIFFLFCSPCFSILHQFTILTHLIFLFLLLSFIILLFVFLLYCLLFVCYSDSLHFHFSVALIFSFHARLVLLFWIFFLFRFTSSSFLNIFTILFRSLSLLPISMLLFWFPHLKTCDYSRAKPLKL